MVLSEKVFSTARCFSLCLFGTTFPSVELPILLRLRCLRLLGFFGIKVEQHFGKRFAYFLLYYSIVIELLSRDGEHIRRANLCPYNDLVWRLLQLCLLFCHRTLLSTACKFTPRTLIQLSQ